LQTAPTFHHQPPTPSALTHVYFWSNQW